MRLQDGMEHKVMAMGINENKFYCLQTPKGEILMPK
jgi:hypothetical protein